MSIWSRIVEFPWLSLDEQYKAITAAHRLLMDPYLRARYHLWKNINDERVVRSSCCILPVACVADCAEPIVLPP